MEGTAIPLYVVSWATAPEGGRHRLTLHVEQQRVPASFRMAVPIRIGLADGSFARTRVWVEGEKSDIQLPLLPQPVRHVEFNEFESVLCTVKNAEP